MATKLWIGKKDDIDVKSSRIVTWNGMEVAIFHLSNGQLLAIENRCPHKGGKLSEGMVCGGVVHCPLHDWRIDLQSGKVQEPDDGCITTFETMIDPNNGNVFIVV